jgi:hypothetical protein
MRNAKTCLVPFFSDITAGAKSFSEIIVGPPLNYHKTYIVLRYTNNKAKLIIIALFTYKEYIVD